MKKNDPKKLPPKWADRFLNWFCKPDLLEHIQGDLWEIFEDELKEHNPRKARWNYRFSVLGLCRPGIVRQFELPNIISRAMFKNYFKIAGRQIVKHKLFTALNVIGLATSMSVSLLIIMMLEDQFSYDHFHTNKDRIVRIVSDRGEIENRDRPLEVSNATTPYPMGAYLKEKYPWVEQSVLMLPIRSATLIKGESSRGYQGLWADPTLHEVFDLGWQEGNVKTALSQPNSIVLTEKVVDEYLKTNNPIGETVEVGQWGTFKVTGVMPNLPNRTHFRFDFLISKSTIPRLIEEDKFRNIIDEWDNTFVAYNYLLLAEDTNKKTVDEAILAIENERNQKSKTHQFKYAAQPLLKITPGTIRNNNMGPSIPMFFYLFLLTLSVLIMLTACFNYTNLTIARSLKRAKEIGIRKVSGAKRGQIITQFLVESVLISVIAVILATFLMEIIVPAFYGLDPEISRVMFLEKSAFLFFLFFIFSLVIGLFAGIIPALHLSSFQPIQVLQKLSNVKLFSKIGLRKFLIIVQFSLSLLFILGTLIILEQQSMTLNQDMGFTTENIINVRLDEIDYKLVEKEFENVNGVAAVSGATIVPGLGRDMTEDIYTMDNTDSINISFNYVTTNYLRDMELDLLAGTDFREVLNKEESIILNASAVNRLGYENYGDVVGQRVIFPVFNNGKKSEDYLKVVGVVEDFNFRRVYEPIGYYGFRYTDQDRIETAVVTVKEGDYSKTLAGLQIAWDKINPNEELAYTFFDDDISRAYAEFNIISKVLGYVAFLAIVIAGMGLLGMVIYTIEGRQKEIGIRKVLGASVNGLVWKLSRGFILLLGIAIAIATPLAWFLGNMWLDTFAVRVSINPKQMLVGIGIVLTIGLVVVMSQTFFAARSNPVDRLQS